MSLISIYYFILLIISLAAYYTLPKKLQKYVLLIASIYFFVQVSSDYPKRFLAILCYIIFVTYLGGLAIDKLNGKTRTVCIVMTVIMLASVLVVLKYLYNVSAVFLRIFRSTADITWLQLAAPIGISYFTLSAIGYLMEVYWKNITVEQNPFIIALFISYFPQIISGPVTRFPEMKKQFDTGHSLEYENISRGMLRMIWGYFQKLVISERFAVVVGTIYGNVKGGGQSGISIIFATLCYAIQLYTDFSGCMDIIAGTSMLYGVMLPENFKAPFFCTSIKEFWQRWHITLGLWFKDYVMYPVQLTKPFIAIGKKSGKIFGKKIGRKISFYVSMLVLWSLIGIWHGGTANYFVASAGIPCILLVASDLLKPYFAKTINRLKIRTDCFSYTLFQRFRTVLLVCLSWVFVCAGGIHNAFVAYKQIFFHFFSFSSPALTFELFEFQLIDVVLMILGVYALFAVDGIKNKGGDVLEVLRGQNIIFKYIVIFSCVLLIFYYGKVGNSSFIYFQF